MTKDEMKNRISMALKDPVLQQGFEILCKENTELENENAELREQCSTLADCNICHSTCKTENIELKKQLTKAKEIIKKFSEFVNDEVELDPAHPQEYTDLWIELCEKAEQFLNSIVPPKMKKKTFEEWKADNSHEIEDLADYFMRHDTEDYFVHDKYLEAYEKIELLCKLAFDRE